jgi:hypothetical protein
MKSVGSLDVSESVEGASAPKKKSKKGLIIAIVLGLAAIGIIIEFAASGGSDDASNSDGASTETTEVVEGEVLTEEEVVEEAPVEDGAPGIGDPAADGKFTFTVSQVECGVEEVGSEFLSETAQGQFCLVTMTDEAQTFDAGSQKGLTNTGAEVEADSTASLYANDDADTFLANINPGNSIKDVVVVYDIAPDQTLDAVILFDSFFSGGVMVSLQ